MSITTRTMGEVFALQRSLDDREFRRALEDFFNDQNDQATLLCRDALNSRPIRLNDAIGFAAQAQAASESFNKLEVFVQEQLARH